MTAATAPTFRKVTAGHYRNDATGVEIIKHTAYSAGPGTGGWHVTSPHLAGTVTDAVSATRAGAVTAAAAYLRVMLNRIAADYADAVAEDIDRAAREVDTSDHDVVGDRTRDGAPIVGSMIRAARVAYMSSDLDRARGFAQAAREEFARMVDADHTEALNANAEYSVFAQNRAWVARHNLRSARPEHVNPAIEADHAAALDENDLRDEDDRDTTARPAARRVYPAFPMIGGTTGAGKSSGPAGAFLTPGADSRDERTGDGDAQMRAFDDRAYMHPAYGAARATRSHLASMLAGQRALISEAHAEAIGENDTATAAWRAAEQAAPSETCGTQFIVTDPGPFMTVCARPARHDDEIGHAPVRFPEGTPEHDAYRAALIPELRRWAAGKPPYEYDGEFPRVAGSTGAGKSGPVTSWHVGGVLTEPQPGDVVRVTRAGKTDMQWKVVDFAADRKRVKVDLVRGSLLGPQWEDWCNVELVSRPAMSGEAALLQVGVLGGHEAWVDDVRARAARSELSWVEAVDRLVGPLGVTGLGAMALLLARDTASLA